MSEKSAPPIARTIPAAVSNHLRQRRAVAALKERMKIHVAGQVYGRGTVISRVMVGGECYEVRPTELDLLRGGMTPEELELDPIPDFDGPM